MNEPTNATTESTPIMIRLRTETRPDHDAVESVGYQAALVEGRLPRAAYVASLGQLLHIHQRLEDALVRHADDCPPIASVVQPHQFQVGNLRADLEHFGVTDMNADPLPATATFVSEIDAIASDRPVALLGPQYVLEGSKNGGKFLASRVRAMYELEGRDGTRYLDPYGEAQRDRWNAFRDAMNTLALPESDDVAVIDASRLTFRRITEMYSELFERLVGEA
jgi:heme oxygenase